MAKRVLPLTAKQKQVLQVMAEGHSLKGTARALGLSVYTVKAVLSVISQKLDVSGAGCVRRCIWIALEQGLIACPCPKEHKPLTIEVETVQPLPVKTIHGAQWFSINELELCPEKYQIRVEGYTVQLHRYSFNILYHLLTNPGIVYTRAQLMDRVWGSDTCVEERVVDNYIRWARNALQELGPKYTFLIETVRYQGYKGSLAQLRDD